MHDYGGRRVPYGKCFEKRLKQKTKRHSHTLSQTVAAHTEADEY